MTTAQSHTAFKKAQCWAWEDILLLGASYSTESENQDADKIYYIMEIVSGTKPCAISI